MRERRICFIATIEYAVRVFLREPIRSLSESHHVTVIVGTKDPRFLKPYGLDVEVIPVAIERPISPFKDVVSLFRLYQIFRKGRFDLVHSVMPKSGLLSMVAGFLARVPVSVHTFTGQVWAT